MAIQKSEAILLYKRDIRETSSIVVFYTKDFGKIKALIKGVRGPQAKFGHYLREFGKYDIVYYEKRKQDTYMVTQCDLKDPYLEIAEELYKRLKVYYILELVDKFTPLEEKSLDIYRLLEWILGFVRKEKFIDKAIIIFQLKLLEYSGFLPQLEVCANCSKPILKDTHFSIRLAGLLCANCYGTDIQAIPFSKGAVATINMFRKQNVSQLSRSTITNLISKELNRLLDRFIIYHLGENLRTQEFIKQASSSGVF